LKGSLDQGGINSFVSGTGINSYAFFDSWQYNGGNPMTRRTTNQVRAFSLVELLVVIAIIAILAAILMPVLSSAKARAQRTACMNNLKQVNLATRLYADENGDFLPDVGLLTYFNFREAIKSYAGLNGPSSANDRIFACPLDTFYYDELTLQLVASGRHQSSDYDYTSYSFNAANLVTNYPNFDYNGPLPGIGGQKISSIKNPARTLLIAEAPAFIGYSWHRPQSLPDWPPIFNNAWNIVSYVDGHLNYLKIYWNSTLAYPNGGLSVPAYYDPPPDYDYQWSGN
jgi:prepilin-type N-terminal cleavage/methylation domain-containing protein